MKRLLRTGLVVWFFSLMVLPSNAQEQLISPAPTQLSDTSPQMNTPGFWVSRHPSPDRTIMTPDEIRAFNASIRGKVKQVKDIASLAKDFSGDELTRILRSNYEDLKNKEYFSRDGQLISGLFLQEQLSNLNLASVASVIEPEFAFVLSYTNQRFLPTDEPFYEQPGDWDFDYLQNNALELATPIVILHKSFDGQWVYAMGPTSDGWVRTRDVVLCAFKDIEDYVASQTWSVVITSKADVFLDPELTKFDQYVQMGARFPQEKKQDGPGVVALKAPYIRSDGRFVFRTVYMHQNDVHDGFLPYTPRTIYQQAFKLLNEPYGWGGMYGEQDCSRFLQEVFATVGIDLPRDSKDQAKVGSGVASFDLKMSGPQKLELFPKAVGGISVLTMKGHIMLYLGEVDKKPYAIHAVWAYREPAGDEDRVRVINRVVVSSLDLGDGSKKGSLFKRLTGIRNFSK